MTHKSKFAQNLLLNLCTIAGDLPQKHISLPHVPSLVYSEYTSFSGIIFSWRVLLDWINAKSNVLVVYALYFIT